MKRIYVIRHTDKNKETGQLTNEGKKKAGKLRKSLGIFSLVITSDRPRTKDTALLLTGKHPEIDARAGFVYSSKEEEDSLRTLAKEHPQSHAGVIFERKEFRNLAHVIGENLVELIKEAFKRLQENEKALIVSQDGVMIAAEKLLTGKSFEKLEKYFLPLEGFVLDETLHMTSFS